MLFFNLTCCNFQNIMTRVYDFYIFHYFIDIDHYSRKQWYLIDGKKSIPL